MKKKKRKEEIGTSFQTTEYKPSGESKTPFEKIDSCQNLIGIICEHWVSLMLCELMKR